MHFLMYFVIGAALVILLPEYLCRVGLMHNLTIKYCTFVMHHFITSYTYRFIAAIFEPCICLCRNSNGFDNGTHIGKVQCLFYTSTKADNSDMGYPQDSWQWHSDKILHGLAVVWCVHVAFPVSTVLLFLFIRISLKLSDKYLSFGKYWLNLKVTVKAE